MKQSRSLLFMCVVLFVLGAMAVVAQQPTHTVFKLGVCTHFAQMKGSVPVNLSLTKQMGAGYIRDELYWAAIEQTPGQYVMPPAYDAYIEQAVAFGISPLVIFSYGNSLYDGGVKPSTPGGRDAFAKYCEFVTSRYVGQVHLYEVWNEWNYGTGDHVRGTAASYVELLKVVYPRIKAIDPDAVVIAGATAGDGLEDGWLIDMLEEGGLDYCDAVSVHPYVYNKAGRYALPESWLQRMEKLRDRLRHYNDGEDVPLFITEIGWPTNLGENGVNEELSGSYLTRMLLLARCLPFIKGIWIYDLQDDGWDAEWTEHNFGCIRPDATPKAAFNMIRDVSELVTSAEYVGRYRVGDPDVWIEQFRKQDGSDCWAIWSSHEGDDEWQLTLKNYGDTADPVILQRVGNAPVTRPWQENGQQRMLQLTMSDRPWLITGRLEDVGIPDKAAVALPVRLHSFVVDAFGQKEARGSIGLGRIKLISKEAHTPSNQVCYVANPSADWGVGGVHVGEQNRVEQFEQTPDEQDALSLTYEVQAPGAGIAYAEFTVNHAPELMDMPTTIELWVHGDGQGRPLSVRFLDHDGTYHQWMLTVVDWTGWRKISVDLNRAAGHGYDSWNSWPSLQRRIRNVTRAITGGSCQPKPCGIIVREKSESESKGFWYPIKKWISLSEGSAPDTEDNAARFSTRYDEDSLFVDVVVPDDVHDQAYAGESMWKGDSIQIGIQHFEPPYDDGVNDAFTELLAGLTPDGPDMYRLAAQNEEPPGTIFAAASSIERSEHATSYFLKIPLQALALTEWRAGMLLGFSLLVNDSDSEGRKGFWEWGSGIGIEKEPAEYNWLVLAP